MRSAKGFSLIELLIVVAIILFTENKAFPRSAPGTKVTSGFGEANASIEATESSATSRF